MTLRHIALFVLFVACHSFATAEEKETPPIWQLGIPDDSSAEFLPYSNGEFKYNSAIAKRPGFQQPQHRFDYVVEGQGVIPKPQFPAGISGTGAGNHTYIQTETITWNETTGGTRVLELKVIDSKVRNFTNYPVTLNHGADIDGMDLVKHSLRIALPSGKVVRQYLPYDVGGYIKKNGEMVIRAVFEVSPGENTITLLEDSGKTYYRCCHFDYIKLMPCETPAFNPPVLELTPKSGFLYHTIYRAGSHEEAPRLQASVYNLDPAQTYTMTVRLVDYFEKTVSETVESFRPGENGSFSLDVVCPTAITGHIRAIGSLTKNDERLTLQCDQQEIVLRLASVRMIAEPTDEEIERAFVGICGMPDGQLLFDPYVDLEGAKRVIEHYRNYRKTLQLYNERIHSLPWHFLEPVEGQFRWEFWDWMLDGEAKERIRVQLTLSGTPRELIAKHWPERTKGSIWDWIFSCPPDMDRWAKACAAVAERYQDKIADFEIWNEPSEHSVFWFNATAEDYYTLVKVSAEAIRNVAPHINIVAETVWARQDDFIRKIYDLGIGEYIDYPADHYMNDERIQHINRHLDRYGRGKGLINNEAKCDSVGGRGEIDEATRRTAARNLLRNMVYSNSQQISRIYNFVIVGTTWRSFGLIGPDGTPKYSFPVMKTLVNRTMGAEFVRTFDFGKGIEAYAYRYFNPQRVKENGGDNILFLCNRNPDPSPLTLYVGKPVAHVVDLMDNTATVPTENGLLRVELGSDPIMIVGADPVALALQAAVTIDNASYDARPGEPLSFLVSLSKDDPQIRGAGVRLLAGELSTPGAVETQLLPGESHPLRVETDSALSDGIYAVDAEISIETQQGRITIPRRYAVVLTRTRAGENLFSGETFALDSSDWKTWGDVQAEPLRNGAGGAPSLKFTVDGTGAVYTAEPFTVVPGQTYHLGFTARGQGNLRVMTKSIYEDGKEETEHNLLVATLGDGWARYVAAFTAKDGLKSVAFHFYEYKESGWVELSDPMFTRVPKGVPLNRILFAAKAVQVDQLSPTERVARQLETQQTPVSNSGIRIGDYGGEDDLSVTFTSAWQNQTMTFLIRVKDDVATEGAESDALWKSDSVQLDFEPANINGRTESCQFAFGMINGKPVCFRHKTIPSEDLVPNYRIGANPEGVTVAVSREDDVTVYLITLEATAISPTLRLEPGKKMGFSLLVNDNDGTGRKGWIQWSGGIGDVQDSTLFGTLVLE